MPGTWCHSQRSTRGPVHAPQETGESLGQPRLAGGAARGARLEVTNPSSDYIRTLKASGCRLGKKETATLLPRVLIRNQEIQEM